MPLRVHLEVLEHRPHDLADDLVAQQLGRHVRGVLGGDHDRRHLHGHPVLVAHRHLRLAVGAQVGHRGAPHRRQPLAQPVGEDDRERHQLGRLVARVAEHEALVAGALEVVGVGLLVPAGLERVVDALGDVGRLLVERHRDAAGLAVEAVLRPVVADLADRAADDLGDVNVGRGRDLPGHHHLAGRDQRLAGDAAVGVVGEHRVEDAVRDLVGDLVRVALGDGLRGEEMALSHAAAAPYG